MRVALITLNSSDDPAENRLEIDGFVKAAAEGGAQAAFLPEVANCLSSSRAHQMDVLTTMDQDETLAMLKDRAKSSRIWVFVGSLALKSGDGSGKLVNRSFVISPRGNIVDTYDKIHMFDVDLGHGERYEESAGYAAGDAAKVVDVEGVRFGLSICYDLRFAHLFRTLAQSGAQILSIPAAFTAITGEAHWHVLLRARAIENGAFVIAAAQTGTHREQTQSKRQTFGHSLVVSPWGEVLYDGGTKTGVGFVDLDMSTVAQARQKIPSLMHDRAYEAPL